MADGNGQEQDRRYLPYFEHLGLRWAGIDDEALAVEMEMRDDLRGPYGSLQGGVVATLVDVAGASAAARALGNAAVATADISVQYLAPGRVGPIQAVARTLRTRERGAVAEVRVLDLGRDERLVAVGLVAVATLGDRGVSDVGVAGSR